MQQGKTMHATPFASLLHFVLFLPLFYHTLCLYAILSLHSCLVSCFSFRLKFSLHWITKCHDVIWNSVFYCLCSHLQYSVNLMHTASFWTCLWKIPKSFKEKCYTTWILHVTTKRVHRYLCLYIVTSSHQIQNLFRFLLKGHASIYRFI